MTATPRPSRLPQLTAALAIVAGSLCLWTACSPERDYEVLSFFFDGEKCSTAMTWRSPTTMSASSSRTGRTS